MLLIKIIGVCFIISSTFSFGVLKSAALFDRLKFLRECRALMAALREQMFFYRNEIGSILASDEIKKDYPKASEVFYKMFLGEEPDYKFSNSRDRKIITEFVCGLGMSDIESQMPRCDMLFRDIDEQICEAGSDFTSKAKLYSVLSLFAGIGVSLVII